MTVAKKKRKTRGADIEHLLTPLRESIIHKPPFASGSLQLRPSQFSLFYKISIDDRTARFVVWPGSFRH